MHKFLSFPHIKKTLKTFSHYLTSITGRLILPISVRSMMLYLPYKSISLYPSIHNYRTFIKEFSSVVQLCLTLCDPMDCSTPGFPVHHQLPKLAQTLVQLSRWCHLTISSSVVPFSSCLQSFPASGSFLMSQFFTSDCQSTRASASVLPMNTQDWSPLGWTGWISLQSKGLSRVLSNTTVQKHQFFSAQLSL